MVLFRAEDQADGRGYPFGYDYTEVSGDDDNCDYPYKASESHYFQVLTLREYAQRTTMSRSTGTPRGGSSCGARSPRTSRSRAAAPSIR